jgi:two-component system chemotaxis response regulator CheB
MPTRDIIVIGASSGGFEAIKRLVGALPVDLPASIFIVWHMPPDIKGVLPQVLNKLQTLPAANAVNNERIQRGRIYIAPPDYHLVIEQDRIRTTKGPKENRFRPAVDPLFRSAAYSYGSRVIGIVLSGALDDGTAGLWVIKHNNGIAIVQDPDDAVVRAMPENALGTVDVDYKVPVSEMPALLSRLVKEPIMEPNGTDGFEKEKVEAEVGIAMDDELLKKKFMDFGELTPYTCPECHGVLSSIREGSRIRFRCHTGHAFSADSLLATLTENIEENIWNALRSVQESVMFLNHMGDHLAAMNRPHVAALYFKKAKEAEERSHILRNAIHEHEQLSSDSIQDEANEEIEPK